MVDPNPRPNTEIIDLRDRCKKEHVAENLGALALKSQAHLAKSSLSSFIGESIEIDPNNRRHLLLDFMGRATHISVAPSTII